VSKDKDKSINPASQPVEIDQARANTKRNANQKNSNGNGNAATTPTTTTATDGRTNDGDGDGDGDGGSEGRKEGRNDKKEGRRHNERLECVVPRCVPVVQRRRALCWSSTRSPPRTHNHSLVKQTNKRRNSTQLNAAFLHSLTVTH